MSIAPWAPKANVFARNPGFVSEAAEARSAQLPVCVLIRPWVFLVHPVNNPHKLGLRPSCQSLYGVTTMLETRIAQTFPGHAGDGVEGSVTRTLRK